MHWRFSNMEEGAPGLLPKVYAYAPRV